MNEAIVKRVLAGYGLRAARILPAQKGYRNTSFPILLPDGTMLNLIFYKREPGILQKIHNAHEVANYLAQHNFPARRTFTSRIAQLRAGTFVQYAALYDYLPGSTIPWETYTMEHIKLLGKTMSDMHHQLIQSKHLPTLPHVADEYQQIIAHMERYFSEPTVADALMRKLGLSAPQQPLKRFQRVLTASKHLPGQQSLHMDFVRSNVLFGGNPGSPSDLAITGIIDFEKTAYGHPLFDIARTLSFLLVDCKYKAPEKVRKYFLHSGYRKRGAHPFRNHTFIFRSKRVNLLETLIDMFLFHDFYKFLRHNPYETLATNEHFVRTRALLVARNLLTDKSYRRSLYEKE